MVLQLLKSISNILSVQPADTHSHDDYIQLIHLLAVLTMQLSVQSKYFGNGGSKFGVITDESWLIIQDIQNAIWNILKCLGCNLQSEGIFF